MFLSSSTYKNVHTKAMIPCKRPTTNGPKPNYKHLTLSKTKIKANRKYVRALQALCTLWLPWKTQIHGPNCFTNNDKKQYFPAETKPDMC